jgi:hypothetical protein
VYFPGVRNVLDPWTWTPLYKYSSQGPAEAPTSLPEEPLGLLPPLCLWSPDVTHEGRADFKVARSS